MDSRRYGSVAFVLLLATAPLFGDEPSLDPVGRWDGTVLIQQMSMPFHIDLARSSTGELGGTISIPAEKVDGLPLTKAAVDGASITFAARTDQPFTGTISEDGRTMSGEIILSGTSFPVTLTRTGEPHIAPPPTSPHITSALEGTWTATVDALGGVRLVLAMTNHTDGMATGTLVNVDEGELRMPLTIVQKGSEVNLDVKVVPLTFSGTLSDDGATLAGTFREKGREVPVTFHRTDAAEK